jgi:hypothetical protein
MSRRTRDAAQDNTPEGVNRRAQYAEQALMTEARIIASDVGGSMAVCAMMGATVRAASEFGIGKSRLIAMLIDVLYTLTQPTKR